MVKAFLLPYLSACVLKMVNSTLRFWNRRRQQFTCWFKQAYRKRKSQGAEGDNQAESTAGQHLVGH